MKRLILIAALVLAWSTLASAQTITIYTANVQHGEGTDAGTNYLRQVTALADGDLIAVQERTTDDIGWNSPLSSFGLDQAVYRENHPDQGDGPAIWYKTSRVTILDTQQTDLQVGTLIGHDGSTVVNKAAVAAKVRVNGKDFWFVSTHLCWSACADSSGSQFSAQREGQITTLLNWVNSTLTGGLDVIIAGDMNFGPDYPKNGGGLIKSMFTAGYNDLWNVGLSSAKATAAWTDRDGTGGADMPVSDLGTRTHDTRRIDYIFLKTGATSLALSSISVPDNRATCPHALVAGGAKPSCSPEVTGGPGVSGNQWDIEDDYGVRPSDHNFVKAVLHVGPVMALSCPATAFVDEPVVCDGSASVGVNGQSGWSTTALSDGRAAVLMDFGDSLGAYSQARLLKAPHAYRAAGTYTVTLTGWDSAGVLSSTTASITVSDIPTATAGNTQTLTDQGSTSANCTALQGAITTAYANNTVPRKIRLPAINYPCDLNWPVAAGTQYVTFEPTVTSWLPAAQVRLNGPAQTANMPKIQSPGVDQTPVNINGSTRGYARFIGIEFSKPFSGHLHQLVAIGSGATTYAQLPTNIIFKHCYFHGNQFDNTVRAIFINAVKFSLLDSYIEDMHAEGEEAQGVSGFAGAGIAIDNNYIVGLSQGILFGGADAGVKFQATCASGTSSTGCTLNSSANLRVGDGISLPVAGGRGPWSASIVRSIAGNAVTWDQITNQAGTPTAPDTTTNGVRFGASPQDILVTRNYFFKSLIYKCTDNPEGGACIPGPEYNGSYKPVVKNIFELKHAMRVVVSGNVMQNHWGQQGQPGPSVLFTPRNQTCYLLTFPLDPVTCPEQTNPWAMVRDVDFEANKVLNVADWIDIIGTDNLNPPGTGDEAGPSAFTQYIRAANNLVITNSSNLNGGGAMAIIFGGARHIALIHNTIDDLEADSGYILSSETAVIGTTSHNVHILNSIFKHREYGFIGEGFQAGDFMAHFFPDGKATHNVISDEQGLVGGENWATALVTPNYFPATIASVFVDRAAGNYRVATGSPFKAGGATPAADGLDMGPNISALDAATLHAIDGNWAAAAGPGTGSGGMKGRGRVKGRTIIR